MEKIFVVKRAHASTVAIATSWGRGENYGAVREGLELPSSGRILNVFVEIIGRHRQNIISTNTFSLRHIDLLMQIRISSIVDADFSI